MYITAQVQHLSSRCNLSLQSVNENIGESSCIFTWLVITITISSHVIGTSAALYITNHSVQL